jgi:hypothetical protein
VEPNLDEWYIKERLRWSLSRRFLVRFHAAFILLGAVLVGWSANRLLFQAGVENMLVRLPAGVVAAYGGFLLGIELWIRYSGIQEYLNSKRSKELLESKGADRPPLGDPWPYASAIPADGEGCLFLILLLLVIAIAMAMGGYLVVWAGDLFAEVVFELLLAAGLLRGIRRVDTFGLSRGIPKVTLPALLVALAVSIGFGLWAHLVHPEARTMAEAIAAEKASFRANEQIRKR